MFKITCELVCDTDVDEQCRTIARKVDQALKDRIKPGPVKVAWQIRAAKFQKASPIIAPHEAPSSIILPGQHAGH